MILEALRNEGLPPNTRIWNISMEGISKKPNTCMPFELIDGHFKKGYI